MLAYATHATALGSADYTLSAQQHGAVEEKIEASFDAPVTALHFTSWGGDMSADSPEVPEVADLSPKDPAYDRFERIAVHVTDVVLRAVAGITTTDDPDVSATTTRYPINLSTLQYDVGEFPYPNGGVYCNSEPDCDFGPQRQDDLTRSCTAFPDESPAPTQTMHTVGKLGGLHFMSWPGESGTRLAQGSIARLQARAGVDDVLFIGYGNDYLGYQLEEDDWWLGGYEAGGGMWGPRQGEYMRDRADEIFGAWHAEQAGDEPQRFDFVEPEPLPLFDSGGGAGPTPEDALRVGTVLLEPAAAVLRDGVASFTVAGSEPWVGRPIAVLQRAVDAGGFVDVAWRNGRSVDSDSYAFWVEMTPVPDYREVAPPSAREFQWTFHFPVTRREAGYDLLSGDHRFRVWVPDAMGGAPAEVVSAPFAVD
jgi:hypothetical protein